MRVKTGLKIAVLLMLVIAAFSMGCAQKNIKAPAQSPAPSSSSPTPSQTPATPSPNSNVTQLEKTLNTTLENVDQLLNQLNDINNISFTV